MEWISMPLQPSMCSPITSGRHCKQFTQHLRLCRFRHDVVLEARMKAIADIIEHEQFPEFICFQVLSFLKTFSHLGSSAGGHTQHSGRVSKARILGTLLCVGDSAGSLFCTSTVAQRSHTSISRICFSSVSEFSDGYVRVCV